MKYILAERQLVVLTTFALSNVLLAFDFDGTLAPIAARPQLAEMRESTKRLMARAAVLYPSIVISGRALDDIAHCMDGVPVWNVFGNHGIEPGGENVLHARRTREWMRLLGPPLAKWPGVVIEDKRYSITVHYRRALDKPAARRAIRVALGSIKGARVFDGKQAVNVLPRSALNKGIALEHARRLVACDNVIYVGDDRTDEDAFGAAPRDRLLSVRIGQTRQTRATYYLQHQREIDRFLRVLISLRRHESAPVESREGADA